MPQILRTTLIADEAVAADGIANYDLPVNPLSVVLITVKALNLDPAPVSTYSRIAQLLAMIPNLNIRYRGATIIDGSLTDLAVAMAALTGWHPLGLNAESADNQVRAVTVPICLGRVPYDPMECFPATRRGDLVLQLNRDIANLSHDGLVLQAETIELLDAEPERFCKITTQSPPAFVAGQNFVELPIGNHLLGLILQSFNVPDAADYQASFGAIALLVDNVEVIWSETNWETLHGELARRIIPERFAGHRHNVNVAAVATDTPSAEEETANSLLENYALMDLDPLKNGQYAIDTTGASQVRLRVTSDAADATQSRMLPIELVKTTTGRAAAA
jgi:hypothetical protein